jgi:hypothetical protein
MNAATDNPNIPPPPGSFLKVFSYLFALPASLLAMVMSDRAWQYVVVFFLLVLLDVAFLCLTKLHEIQHSAK